MISQLRMHDKLFALFELLSKNEFAKLDDNVLKDLYYKQVFILWYLKVLFSGSQ